MSLWAPPAEIWIWWSVSFYFQSFPSYWFGYYKHFFVASCVAFSCRWGIDFICKALMTSIWPGSMRNSILSWYMRWHLGLQMMADKLWSQQVGGWSEGEVLCVQQLGGRWICSPEPSRHFCWVHAEIFELPSLLKLKESRYRRGAADLWGASGCLYF